MKLFNRLIRAVERAGRSQERRQLTDELQDIFNQRKFDDQRAHWIIDRLSVLDGADLDAYLNRDKPIKSVSEQVKDAEYSAPEGLAGEWKAPV